MADLKDKKDSDYLFMQEKIKQKPIYQNRTVRKCASCILSGVLFALAALGVWAFALPFLDNQAEEQEIQPIEIPEEEENTETEEEEDSWSWRITKKCISSLSRSETRQKKVW